MPLLAVIFLRLAAGPETQGELVRGDVKIYPTGQRVEVAGQEVHLTPIEFALLRALASLGIFREAQDGRFGMTPAAEPLRSDVPSAITTSATST